jgi:hypothetical protein
MDRGNLQRNREFCCNPFHLRYAAGITGRLNRLADCLKPSGTNFLNKNDSHFLTSVMGRNIILTIPKTSPFDVYLASNVVIVSYS